MNDASITGSLGIFTGFFAPRNWAFCAGQLFAISDFSALYSIIGDAFGGDGRSSVGLPDLRGRVVLGEGQGPEIQYYRFRGQMGGIDENILSEKQLPTHSHAAVATVKVNQPHLSGTSTFRAYEGQDSIDSPDSSVTLGSGHYAGTQPVAIYANETANTNLSPEAVTTTVDRTKDLSCDVSVTNSSTGSGQPIDNMPPFTVIGYYICLDGIYPLRN